MKKKAEKPGKMTNVAIAHLYEYLQGVTRPLNESKIFAGIMIILLNLATKHVNWNLPKPIESYLKFTFSRNILVFAICWVGSRDILVALCLTTVFIVVMDYILNDSSAYCCLPEGFVDYYTEKLEAKAAEGLMKDNPKAAEGMPKALFDSSNNKMDEAVAFMQRSDPTIAGPGLSTLNPQNFKSFHSESSLQSSYIAPV